MKKKLLALFLALSTLVTAGCNGTGTGSGSNGGTDSGSTGGSDVSCLDHADMDDDGVCDVCDESVLRDLTLLAVNDLHGKVLDGTSHIGVDELTTYYNQLKAENPNTVLLSSGDMWQGASVSNYTKGAFVTDWMNEVGFAAMTLGNHEFDWGEDKIRANAERANFPFLAINVYDRATNQRADYCEASLLYQVNDIKVGIIGAIGDCYSSISSSQVTDVYFQTGDALTELVKAESESLKKQGADVIVYSLHDSWQNSSAYNIALSKGGYVDVVFEGHTHTMYEEKDDYGVYHLQGGGDNKGVTQATLTVNIANKKSTTADAKALYTSTYANLAKDPVVENLTETYQDVVEQMNRVVGYTDSYRSSDVLCQTAADLYLQAGLSRWRDYDIVLAGAFLSARAPYSLSAGEVTYGSLYDILPFDNQIVLCSISGAKLKSQFINTTNTRYRIAYNGTVGTINDNATYYIVTDTYTSDYSWNGLTEVARYDDTTFARDLLAEYIGTGAWGTKNEIKITSIADILSETASLISGATSDEEYTLRGVITQAPQGNYGNTYVQDDSGKLYIYGIWDESGTVMYNNLPVRPTVGDTVTLQGHIKNYNGLIEMMNARLLDLTLAGGSNGGTSGGSGSGSGSGNTGGGSNGSNGGSGGGSSGSITESDPYIGVNKTKFYASYTPAKDYMDAYYRTLHNLMSGSLEVPDQAPTVAKNQPKSNGMFIKNTEFLFADNGKTYIVVDAQGAESFRVYKDGAYTDLEEVAAYIYAFGTVPANYDENKDASPASNDWAEYLRVNHSYFSGNTSKFPYEPVLPNISGCGGTLRYYELDIGTTGTDCDPKYTAALYNNGSKITRGAARIVYGKDDLNGDGVYQEGELHLFYTYNHYNDFQEYLNYEGGWGEMFGNITGGGSISSKTDYNPTSYVKVLWTTL